MTAGLLGAFAALACGPTSQAADLSERLESTLEEFRIRHAFPGATAAIALPDGRVASAAVGLADVEAARPMTAQTPMLAASIGKTFVAATVLRLESEQRLARDDLLAEHLGHRPWFTGLPNASSITLDHLLHHTAGLPDHVHLPEFQPIWSRAMASGTGISPEDLIGVVTGLEPLFEPGSAWAYSDTGYILLGLVIEQVSGESYNEMVDRYFIKPLGLNDTRPSDRPDLPGLAVGYVAADNLFGLPERTADAAGNLLWNPAIEWTGGGLASTAPDLALWGQLLLTGQAMDVEYLDRLLAGVPVDARSTDAFYGAGVGIHPDTPRGPVYGHGGWIPGYVSSLRHYADHEVTVAFQINTDASIQGSAGDLVPDLEAALADLALAAVSQPSVDGNRMSVTSATKNGK
ncbi:MAG: serine hydrolase domain-containing protein [Wenzhouxiangella sp.]|jgi:D-alanyl-D-alanine carboxypeptidase|nr:serine hydrolase domain-containing protein [Wenzhouxiangella sp.]